MENFGIFDLLLMPLLLFFYYRAPLQRIADTALLMNAYGRDGATWKRRLLRQYWQPPVYYFVGIIAVTCLVPYLCPEPDRATLGMYLKAALYIWFAMVGLWPLVFCIRANRAYYRLEAWREVQIEQRIAAGMASSADYYGYIQNVKEREYNRGYSAGRMMSRFY